MLADEVAALAVLAEAQHLELQHDGDDEVVVGMKRADILRRDAGLLRMRAGRRPCGRVMLVTSTMLPWLDSRSCARHSRSARRIL